MANTPTENYGLLKPAHGDAAWDATYNTNLDSVDELIYQANQNIINGVIGPTGPTGPPATFLGAWISGHSYAVGNAVSYNGAGYVCLVATSGTTTPDVDTTHWGINSANAYQLAVQSGFSGTQAQWLASLTGPTGPAGASSISLPVYSTTSAGVAVVAANGYFYIPSTNLDYAYDMYQNVSGTATFVTHIPSALINGTSNFADLLTIKDSSGFKYPLGGLLNTLVTQGVTVYATTSAAFTANVALNAYFFVPSTAVDGLFEVYQNVSNVAIHKGTVQNQLVQSDNVHPISISDASGFHVDILNTDGTDPRFQPAFNSNMVARDLSGSIVKLNQQCMIYSNAISKSRNLSIATAEYLYNYMLWYGQSLSVGFQTLAYLSTAAKYGNLMVGTGVLKNSSTQNPSTDSLFHTLVEQATTSSGETECSGMVNTAKAMINRYLMRTNASDRVFVVNSLGQPGVPISELVPTASVPPPGTTYTGNLYSPIPIFMAAAAVDAASSSSPSGAGSVGLTGFFYAQGENDDNNISTDPTYSTYMANLDAIRTAVNAQAVTSYSQVRQAGFYTYQTGGQYTSDAGGLAIQNCQWIMGLTRPNFFLFGPHAQYPDLGGHLTSNSYRWLGSMAGKVWFLTAVLRQGWQPLSPHKVTIVDSKTLLVGFHVPVAPLTVATAYNVAAAVNYADLGFNLFDAVGFIPITVSIVADQVVQIIASRVVDWTTSYLRYADTGGSGGSTSHVGCGNLTDSDTTIADDNYIASASQSGTPDGTQYDITGLVGNPYPLNNWCIAFQLHPNTFNSTGPVIG